MHIVFVTNEFVSEGASFDGGLSNYLHNISRTLTDSGHKVTVIVTSSSGINQEIKYGNLTVCRVSPPTKNLLLRIFNKVSGGAYHRLLYNIFLSCRLNKKLREVDRQLPVDIVQYPNIRGLAFFKPKHIPAVIRCSGYQQLWDEAQDLYLVTFRERQVQWLEDFVLKKTENIFAPSQLIANYVSAKLSKQVRVIETPMPEVTNDNLDNLIVQEINQRIGTGSYLLYYGRLGNWKGTVELANVLYNFLESNPDMYFVLIGKDKGYKGKPMMDYIKEKAGKHTSRVIYYANLRHEQLFPVIDHAHAVVLPSRIENLSNACIESMARGKVVLGTNGASYEQLITDGVNGFLFEKMNEADLLNKMNLIAKLDDKRREELGNAAKETVKRLHPDVICNQLLNYYTEVIQSFHNSSQKHKHHYGLPATLSSKNN